MDGRRVKSVGGGQREASRRRSAESVHLEIMRCVGSESAGEISFLSISQTSAEIKHEVSGKRGFQHKLEIRKPTGSKSKTELNEAKTLFSQLSSVTR